ncbi:MAG TPA: hypothetical protein PLL09_04720 [Flavobacterium sp.]|uniref:hypothetical protein n=1 Tax=unclassified Flavobacterium TaxID=196869 RepID=UPI0025BA3875|nr:MULTISPECIES: hypothetical protein [unclassified Flavobacterium]HRE77112.1 hypothetical protein [Flavobacterium sp.]
MDKERLKYLLELPFEVLSKDKDLKKELTEFYKFIYGVKVCSSCKDKFPTYHQKLSVDGLEKLEMKSNGNFKLRDNIGVLQINFGEGKFISQLNCADEICIEFLKVNPNRISLFSDFPENWKELIK